ncbi:MAG: porin [Pseudomonadota bacterium]
MKKVVGTVVLMGMVAGVQAQSSVTVYGTIDAGVSKQTGLTTQVNKRDNNKLGFRGTEDLGNGLKALFQLEIRYEPDTGTIESVTRPLFQGQSRVGLQGDFGTVRLGRGLTPFQESSAAFEPWSGQPTAAGFQTDLAIAGYTSDPLSPAGNSRNRISNAVFYNSPVMSGLQVNLSYATKEATAPGGAEARVYPYSLSSTYTAGMFSAMLAHERNAVDTKLWSVAAAVKPIPALKLMASWQKQDQGATVPASPDTSSWLIGANYLVGAGKLLAGYGRKTPDNTATTRQVSLGYEHNLSIRTYLYADISNKKQALASAPARSQTVRYSSVGIHHNF